MIEFNETEKHAMLQCFWQLLGGIQGLNKAQNEIEYISKLVSDWQLSNRWTIIAISQDPYNAFACVSKMNWEQKKLFKGLVKEIVESKGDNDLKTKMAVSLFRETAVPHDIKARELSPFSNNNKGSYEIV